MAYRTTEEAVAKIVEVDSTIDVEPFIEVANELVTEVCADSSYTAARLELIERWLAAHFYSVRDMKIATEAAGSVSQTHQYAVGLNLNVTVYGQQVLILDTDGSFAALQAQAKSGTMRTVGITWLGKTTTDDEELDEDDS